MLNFGYIRDQQGKITDETPYFFFGDEIVQLPAVRTRLIQEAEFFNVTGVPLSDVTVEIRADANVPTGMVQELIQVCQEEGIAFQRFALKATQKAPEH